jgi:hypothetical protein
MKKRINCHYKNGSLLFCTAKGYTRDRACQIMEVFTSQKLTAVMQPLEGNMFRIVGRLNTHYDPFLSNSTKWDDLLAAMHTTMDILEENIKTLFTGDRIRNNSEFIYRRPK